MNWIDRPIVNHTKAAEQRRENRRQQRRRAAERDKSERGTRFNRNIGTHNPHIPPDVQQERERVQATRDKQSATEMLMGDPLPGRSALDKRG